MDTIVKEHFFTVMTRFITHLTRQLNLITDMKIMCLCVINRWLSTEKVIKWFKIHRPRLLAHIKSKQPPSTPPHLWWVSLLAMHHFTSRTTIMFRTIQGLTTLLDQQQAALVGLVASLMEDVGVTRPLIVKAIANFDARVTSLAAAMQFHCLLSVSSSTAWLPGLILLLTKPMKANRTSSSTTSLLFMSLPTIVSPSYPPIAMKTTTRWPIHLPSHQCYCTSSSNYPLPSLFARCVVTVTDWSSVIRVSISTLSPTNTNSYSLLTRLSKSSSRASMRCLVNQPSRMGGIYLVVDSRT